MEHALNTFRLPPQQEAIRAKCFHPSRSFVRFAEEEIERSIPERFEKIVKLYPDRTAVSIKDRSISYVELNRLANRIAHTILQKGRAAGEPVALLLPPGIELITAIFGILKAGKFYVVLDAFAPTDRIRSILQDCAAPLVVTNDSNALQRFEDRTRTFLHIEQVDASRDRDNLNLSIHADHLASILYTSGSTGKPKAVAHSHRSQLHTVMVNTNEARICHQDRLTLLHSIGFGSAQAHVFQSLLNGASLHYYDLKSNGVEGLVQWIKQQSITVYHSPPAVFRQLAEALPDQETLPDLRLIRLSGAPVTRSDFALYAKKFAPRVLLQTVMNSTETNVIASFVTDGTFRFPESGSPAGYPVAGKTILLLGEDGAEVEFGDAGEIAVKSRYLPPGYWQTPGISTIEAGLSASKQQERVCLTGDFGRMCPDGLLIHMGRKDSMVKIRGYRIELSEVEQALQDHPRVKEAAVLAREREPGETILVAYIVSRDNPSPTISALHGFLKTRLPDYMVPGAFVFLGSLPLTNGKLDRNALPFPNHDRPDLDQAYVPPRTALEEKLIWIWEQLLNVSSIGIHDNFFHLGGDSLLATRFVSRVRQAFNVEFPLRRLFELPTVADVAQWIEAHRDELQGSGSVPLVHAATPRELPVSFSQQRLWFLNQLEPGSCAYNLSCAFRLTGKLDVDALERSFNEIIKRHEILRTVFKSLNGEPFQIILPTLSIRVSVTDLRGVPSLEEREIEVSRLSREEAWKPFDLTGGPLLRVSLFQVAEDSSFLLLIIHHIVFDGWSEGILARELSVLYQNFASGKPSPLAALRLQYADFAVWQRRRHLDHLLDNYPYWKRNLSDLPTPLELPTDRPRRPLRSFRGAHESFVLSKTLSMEIRRLSDCHDVTLFMTLLAAYQTLLHRYTGQNDIIIGSPVAGRDLPELEELVGFFLNMLVLRTDLSGNPTFRELVARVREVCLDAYGHQDMPFEKLVEELRPERTLAHNPLFQVTFALRNTPTFPLQLGNVTANEWDTGGATATFDLHLFMVEDEGVLRGWLSYNTDLFNSDTISRLTDGFKTLLEAVVANPDRRISELPILAEAERHQLLFEWNDSNRDYPRDECIHELFEHQVERSSDAVAIVFEDRQLTYRQLNNRASQLAHYLRKLGVGPDVRVGIYLERSVEMIVGILGILKAGGAYVPLDTAYPRERLEFMLADSGASVLLTQQDLIEGRGWRMEDGNARSSMLDRVKVLCFDRDWAGISKESAVNIESGTTPQNLMYIMYTSGSTGTPKGVMVSHRGISNRLLWSQDIYQLTSADRVLQKTPFSFDVSVWEFFWPLLIGARLIIARPQGHRDAEYLVRLITEQEITTVHFVPSMLRNFLEHGSVETCAYLKRVICSGESLSLELQERFFSKLDSELYNLYGPTEASIDVTWWACNRENERRVVPIGRPVANTQIYLLDSHLQPVPIGAAGELYIGGVALARGYLNRPDLTAEKFIPHPFSDEPGARLYRTGDLARYLPDGSIEFLGRSDHQVKIRGYRIELGEIEAALLEHPVVADAAVQLRSDDLQPVSADLMAATSTALNSRLVAYVVLRNPSEPQVNTLRNFLRQKLPTYMLPAEFVFIERLPRTSSGKVDRRALPPPYRTAKMEQTCGEPYSLVEQKLIHIWAELLHLTVSRRDNFFEIGGHSLLAVQLISRMRSEFHVEISLPALFENPTIAELAEAIQTQQAEVYENSIDNLLGAIEETSEVET